MSNTISFGSTISSEVEKPSEGGTRKIRRTSVWLSGSAFPARMKNGTPDHLQLSTSSRMAEKVSVVEPVATPATRS